MSPMAWDELTMAGRRKRLRSVAMSALRRYDITPDRLTLIATDTNTVYKVSGPGGPWMLRVAHAGAIEHPIPQVHSEMQVLVHLSDAGIPVPRPVAATDGAFVQLVEAEGVPGERRCVLLKWLPGKIVGERVGPVIAGAYGRMAADLHTALARFAPGPDFEIVSYDSPFPFDEPVVLWDAPRSILPEARRRLFEATRDQVQSVIDRLASDGGRQVLHGDLHIWNVITDGGVLGAIDFEDLMWGWPVQDIATTLYYVEGEDRYPAFLEAFRSGYRAAGTWPSSDDIATFLAARSLVMCNDALLLADDPDFDLDPAAFLSRAQRRIERFLG